MKRIASLGIAGLLSIAGVPAAAQVASSGSILPDPTAEMSTRSVSEADRAHQTMNDYAVCIVKKQTVSVRKALARGSDSEQDAALAKLAIPDCLGSGELHMAQTLMRGAIYRALYLRDFGRVSPSTTAVEPAPDDNPMRKFGRCVNAIDPANVRAAVMSVPGTTAERQIIGNLGPALAQCIPPSSQIHFSRAVLQGVLAEAAYRQAKASSEAGK